MIQSVHWAPKGSSSGKLHRVSFDQPDERYAIVTRCESTNMDQILPHQLWVGHAGDGRNSTQLLTCGIKSIVQVAFEDPPLAPPRELVYLRFPLIDGGGNKVHMLKLTIVSVASLVEYGVPTLICCGSGMSRSPAIAAAALAVANRKSPESCLHEVIRSRRGDVSPGLWSEIVVALCSLPDRM